MNPFQAIEYAVELLLTAGFTLKYQSMKTEARYYCWHDDDHNVIRVAAHTHDRGMTGLGRIVGRVTFSEKSTPGRGFSHEYVENVVANAIGMYQLRTSGAVAYKGRQPRLAERKEAPAKGAVKCGF